MTYDNVQVADSRAELGRERRKVACAENAVAPLRVAELCDVCCWDT